MYPKDETVFEGKIGEVIHSSQDDGRVFERYRRPTGTRLIILSPDNKILITKEHRHEAAGIDLRLPGGKVCDTLMEYHELLASGKDMLEAASEAAEKEAREETGINVKNMKLLTIANAGATVEWDLYYFLVDEYATSKEGQQLEVGETIEVTYMSPHEIREAVHNGHMQEWRSVGVLLGLVLPELERMH